MKKICIVTDFKGELSHEIKNNLTSVFEDRVIINEVYLEQFDDNEIIDGDIILFMLENRVVKYHKNIKNIENILIISRTVSKNNFNKLLEIPINEKVLVVNDYYETSLQLTSLLYKTELKHLNFITYNSDTDHEGIKYAVTTGIKKNIPDTIPNIIDLGVRCLESFTIMSIMNKLNIEDSRTRRNLLNYIDTIVTIDNGVDDQYRNLYFKNKELTAILGESSNGIMLINEDDHLSIWNDRAQDMLGISLSKKIKLSHIFRYDLITCITPDKNLENELININNKELLVSIKTIFLHEGVKNRIVVLKDVTHIKKLEQAVRGKLKINGYLAKYDFSQIIYFSPIMEECIMIAKKFSTTDMTVLIHGESGTGKELFAQSIHNNSDRSSYPFVAINCAAIPENLLESELFGYEKGAFTGANNEGRAGIFEKASSGTIFLDEIGDIPYNLQSKLLRVIQEQQVMRLGSNKIINIDVRIICATNKNLLSEVNNNRFREDLYYRLNVLPLEIPPLRKRKRDIIPLFKFFYNQDTELPDNIVDSLISQNWRGNVRELKNAAEYYALMKDTNNPLPYELLKTSEENCDMGYEKKILNIIYKKQDGGTGIGREKLLEYINCGSDKISGYKLRKILSDLKSRCYIENNVGRSGCKITKKGITLIKLDQ